MYHPPVELDVRKSFRGGGLVEPHTFFVSLQGRTRVVVFVHGFNNGVEPAKKTWETTYRQLVVVPVEAAKLNDLVLFYWPGDERNPILSTATYFDKVEVAVKSGELLAGALVNAGTPRQPVRVCMVGHSLGCRVVLSALRSLSNVSSVEVDKVVLMAAAVPEGLCEPGAVYGAKVGRSETVIFSDVDEALGSVKPWLQVSPFRVGQFLARHTPWLTRDEDPGSRRVAVGLGGQPTTRWDGEVESTGLQHGQYWTDTGNVRKVAAVFAPAPTRKPPERRAKSRRTGARQTPIRDVSHERHRFAR